MKYRFTLLLLSFCLVFFSGCVKAPAELMLDSFEGEINPATVDFGASENSRLSVSCDKQVKFCGEQSLKLDFELNPSGYMWAARGYGLDVAGAACWEVLPQEIKWRRYNAFSLAFCGEGSGGAIAFDIKDSGGELWRFLVDDDTAGWKEVVCPFAEFFPRADWQPEGADGNQALDFPVNSFQFEPRVIGSGVYRFDCLKLIKIKR